VPVLSGFHSAFLYQGCSAVHVLLVELSILAFGVIFAINSAVHCYLIVAYAKMDGVSLDVGFDYMANTSGRLSGYAIV